MLHFQIYFNTSLFHLFWQIRKHWLCHFDHIYCRGFWFFHFDNICRWRFGFWFQMHFRRFWIFGKALFSNCYFSFRSDSSLLTFLIFKGFIFLFQFGISSFYKSQTFMTFKISTNDISITILTIDLLIWTCFQVILHAVNTYFPIQSSTISIGAFYSQIPKKLIYSSRINVHTFTTFST